MFARKRAAMFHDQISSFFDERAKLLHARRRFEIEVDARMDATLSEVSIETAKVAVFVEKPLQIAQVTAKPMRRHGGIFPAFPVFFEARNMGRCAEARFAHMPNAFFLRGIIEKLHGGRVWLELQRAHQFARGAIAFFLALTAKFEKQKTDTLRQDCKCVGLQMTLSKVDH